MGWHFNLFRILGLTPQALCLRLLRRLKPFGQGRSWRELENRLKFAREVIALHLKYDREIVAFRQVAVGEKDKEIFLLAYVAYDGK